MSAVKTSRVTEYKKVVVAELIKKLKDNQIIGLLNMENLPAPQLQRMKGKLRGKVEIFMTKKRLIKIALNEVSPSKPGVIQLLGLITGMPALLFTKENPFKLGNELKKSKTAAPAKAGQTAPKDIIIPPGPTSFAPGPIISELSGIGLKTGVEAGKVVIKQEHIAAKAGDKITPKVADILAKLGIEPMEVGLNLVAVYENGMIYGREVLALDQDMFLSQLAAASSEANAVAIYIGYASKDTIHLLIAKAFAEATSVACAGKIETTMEAKSAPAAEEKQEEQKEAAAEVKAEPVAEAAKEEPKVEAAKEEPQVETHVAAPIEAPKEEKKAAAVEKNKKKEATAEIKGAVKNKVSDDFREEITAEKERREKIDAGKVEDLTKKLKQKGTFREG